MHLRHPEGCALLKMENPNEEIWTPCLTYFEARVNKESYYTWLKPTWLLSVVDNTLTIGVPNKFVADWVKDHYGDLIGEALTSVTGRSWHYRFEIHSRLEKGNGASASPRSPVSSAQAAVTPHRAEPLAARPAADARASASLSQRYTFENFVVGDSNQLAHAASSAVAQQPSKTRFNPMCIYGTVGLGKTHLAQAIGNALLKSNPGVKVLYVTSEQFTNDFIYSLAKNTTPEFTGRYRSVDVLLIDDIQFFAGKESTQVQFFHTFNTLYQNGKQIVMTSDRAPKDIKGLEERLLSRFQWGLAVDIRQPDFETRMAILRKKLDGESVVLPDDVLAYVARAANANIRELEGALVRLLAVASLEKTNVTLETAQQILRDSLPTHRKPITIAAIIAKVSELFDVPGNILISKRRTQEVVIGRHVAMYLARTLTNLSLKAIGAEFGGRDHSTVIHGVSIVRSALRKNPELRSRVEQAQSSLCGQML
jgi:chromosomal replication initiator protein